MKFDASPKYWRYLGLDQKRSYYVNMFVSTLIVNSMVCVATFILIMWPKEVADFATVQFDVVSVTDTSKVGASGVPSMGRHAGSSGQGSEAILFPENFPSSFMPDIKIIRDHSPPTISMLTSVPIEVYEPIRGDLFFSGVDPHSDNEEDSAFGNGTGDEYGDGDDFGLPPQEPYMPRVTWTIQPSGLNIGRLPESGLIVLVDLRWPNPTPKTDTGYVVIIIDIDKKGRIEWEVIDEQPTGKGFANALIEALKRSTFNPPVDENGEKLPVRVMLASTICYGCPAHIESIRGTMETLQLHRN